MVDLTGIDLSAGAHTVDEHGTCLMEAVAIIAGETKSDYPACVAAPLSALGIEINDAFGDSAVDSEHRNALLKPIIPSLINTSSAEARLDPRGRKPLPEHERKILAWLNEQGQQRVLPLLAPCTEKLALTRRTYSAQQLVSAAVVEIENSESWTGDMPTIHPALVEAAAILKEGAAYAKQLLAENEPTTTSTETEIADDFTPTAIHIHH
jgi:hypothetical protein